MAFTKESIRIDPVAEVERLVTELRRLSRQVMRRHGGVVGISGGVDSAVVLALAVRAFGPEHVVAVMMPEKDSDPLSERLARELASQFGVKPILEDITAAVASFGCYTRRDEAVRRLFPEYDAEKGYKVKITLPQNLLEQGTLNCFSLGIITPDGRQLSKPLPVSEFLQIVAASNFKQRTRMAILYYHAELRNYAVLGTANKNEHDQGFFVKHGDAGVDVKTIGHLYKTQVYQLAEYLGVSEEILRRPPTSDTYSAPCDQQEFFFRLPFAMLDLLWYAQEHGVPIREVATVMGLTEIQVSRVFDDLSRKRRSTEFLRMPPLSVDSPVKMDDPAGFEDLNFRLKHMNPNQDIEGQLKDFIARNLLFSADGFPYSDNASFLGEGIVDSLGVMELVEFVGKQFGVAVEQNEVTPENFDSIQNLSAFVRRKQNPKPS